MVRAAARLVSVVLALAGVLSAADAETISDRVKRDGIVEVPRDDAAMAAAMRKARASLPRFLELAAAPRPSTHGFAVKVAVRGRDATEYFWIAPFKPRGKRFAGIVGNTPRLVTHIKEGQTITFARSAIVDWMYRDDGKMIGNRTACVLLARGPASEAEDFKTEYGLDCAVEPVVAAPDLRPRPASPPTGGPAMIGWVVLSNTHVELTVDALRQALDDLYPGEFLPPREQGNLVVEGAVPLFQFMINSAIPGASGTFLLHTVPGPYTEFSDFADHIKTAALRRRATGQCCWLAVDVIGKTEGAKDYPLIGKLLAKLAPADAAGLVHPSRLTTIGFNERVRRKLADGELPP